MMPIVDALMHLPAGTACEPSAKESLDDYLAQHTEFHILRVLAVQPMLSSTESAAHAQQLQTLATTRGSGGLPHGLLVYATLNESVDSCWHAIMQQTLFRGFTLQINDRTIVHNEIEKSVLAYSLAELESTCSIVNITMPQVTQASCRTVLELLKQCSTLPFALQFDGAFSEKGNEQIIARFLTEYSQNENACITIAGFHSQQHNIGVEWITAKIAQIIKLFGYDRIMFGSNYPNMATCGSYDALWRTYSAATTGVSATNRDKLFRRNALGLYQLKP